MSIGRNSKLNLSPKIFLLFIIEITLFILKAKTAIEIFDFFFVFVLVLFLLDIIWLGLNYLASKKVSFRRIIPEKLVEEDELKAKIVLDNRNFLPFFGIEVSDYLSCAEKDKERFFIFDFVKAKKSSSISYSCLCNQRGKYLIGPLRVIYASFLGLFRIETVYGLEKVLYVYPKTFRIGAVPPLTRGALPWFGLDTVSASGDEDEFFGLREYKKGDPLKRIHWFSTAKKSKLIVKEFQRCNFYQASLIFLLNQQENLGSGKKSVAEYMIKIAASLSKYFINEDICVGLLSHAGRVCSFTPNKGQEYLEEMFKFYAEAVAESHINMREFIEEYYNLIPSNSTLLVLVTEKNVDVLVEILSLREKNVSVIALVVLSLTFASSPENAEDAGQIKESIEAKLAHLNIRSLFFQRDEPLEKEFLK
ncbi:MAG: DUF58 domain-containing protein [Candidatus Omnitrophica bacterium]|nr:DUF58 domain-containing protein [Candidatus Omnitrophota bacterium]MCF7878363.1 DUF58 domain-containing protein [Candidatus Omnitrophota bacterium]MCF7893037.1 DUF58 domain-containing protein [Candidatus Omnitrophota bacterium]